MRAGLSAAAAALLLALLVGCDGRFDRFTLSLPDGGSIRIRESPAAPPQSEGVLELGGDERGAPLYRFAREVSVESDGLALAVSYQSALAGVRLALLSGRNTVIREVLLPASSALQVRYLVALARGETLWGLRFTSTEASPGRLTLKGLGIVTNVTGLALSGAEITLDGSLTLSSASKSSLRARFSEQVLAQMQGRLWRITVDLPRRSEGAPGPGGSSVTFTGGDGETTRFLADEAAGSLEFYGGNIGFLPEQISLSMPESTLGPSAAISLSQVPTGAPIPADPGTILSYDKARWRRSDFEVFSWNRYPEVLIFDTATYAVQDRLFKRLAFYVEKAGYAGSIPEVADLEGLHGYNAHDYRAEDLASFFTLATQQGRSLTAEEALLRSILVDDGVIAQSRSGFTAGSGSVLSISRSSSAVLRDLLITHECFHGLFFSLAAYREACTRTWDALSGEEREVWLSFLGSRDYDTGNPYLVVNEFQSYLMQQSRQGVAGFQSVTLSRVSARSATDEALVRRLLTKSPQSFLASFDRLEAALAAAGGPLGGRVISMTKAAK